MKVNEHITTYHNYFLSKATILSWGEWESHQQSRGDATHERYSAKDPHLQLVIKLLFSPSAPTMHLRTLIINLQSSCFVRSRPVLLPHIFSNTAHVPTTVGPIYRYHLSKFSFYEGNSYPQGCNLGRLRSSINIHPKMLSNSLLIKNAMLHDYL